MIRPGFSEGAIPTTDPAFAHDSDRNPHWRPKMAMRVIRCSVCGHEHTTTTNHTGACYPVCNGECYQIIGFPGTRIGVQTKHVYVRDAS